jgi:NAD(P)-dependent dehydrogenase (short-subunit alcohol dehydrogenase family)
MPLVLQGTTKKVITISTGMADADVVTKYNVHEGVAYTISKAAMNMAVAKFQAEYAEQGVLFMAISPGVINSGQCDDRRSFTTT